MFNLLFLLLSFAAVVFFSRDFSHLNLFGLYITELLFLIWVLANITVLKPKKILEFIKANKWIVGFFLWGLFLLILDLLSHDRASIPLQRVAQHAILFVYPLVWSFVGYGFGRLNTKFSGKLLIGLVIIQILGTMGIFLINCFSDQSGIILFHNFVIGPLALAAFCFAYSKNTDKKWLALLGLFVFLPFWQMWGTNFSRTGLVQLLVGFFILPWFFPMSKKARMSLPLIMSTVLLLGFVGRTLTLHPNQNFIENFYADFLKSAQHGEDAPLKTGEKNFQARFRKFIWTRAILDWQERPILGVGFIPEVPSWAAPWHKNTGGFSAPAEPPISGPHNSFLTILARMGPLGLFLFITALVVWIKTMATVNLKEKGLLQAIVLFGFIHAFFNIGLETPHNTVILLFCIGLGLGLGYKNAKKA